MEEPFANDLQRVTARMNQVHLANALVKKGQFAEALQLLRNVRQKYTDPAMSRQIDLLIADVQARSEEAGHTGLAPAREAKAPASAPAPRPPRGSSTETRHVPRGAPSAATPKPSPRPDPTSALARARSELASIEETLARARAAAENKPLPPEPAS